MADMAIPLMVEQARVAQQQIFDYTQEQVDVLCKTIAKIVYDRADELARMAHEETRMGVYEHKIKKNMGKARIIWNHIKDKKSVGILAVHEDTGIVEVAKPLGIVACVTPCTNPIVTPMCNAMYAIKGRNAVIIAPHPRAKKCTQYLVGLFNYALAQLGAPANLIQAIEEPTNEKTAELMKACDVVVSTGGMGIVKAAYSSGKPALGVGVGNVQTIIDRDVDFSEAARKIVEGREFDNGIICSGEQTVIVHRDDYDRMIEALKSHGVCYFDDTAAVDKLRETVFPNGIMNKDLVGQSAIKVAEAAGVTVPAGTRVIAVKAEGYGKADLFSKEKMCPVFSTYAYDTFKEAVDIAEANLNVEGKGHTVSLHSFTKENIEYAGERLPISRLLLNQICSTMNGGSFFNGLAPTTTLGCGSWGNNSISENLDYKHMFNVTRIAYFMKDAVVPTDEEMWR